MQSVDVECDLMDDNQACYGHALLDAIPQPNRAEFDFAEPGDLAALLQLQTLRASALDLDRGFWGIALMQLLAQVQSANPEVVSMLIFGSVEVQSQADSTAQVPVEVQGNAGVHIRNRPFVNSTSLLQVSPFTQLIANGRLADTSWLRIEVPDSGRMGWVFTDLVISDDDLTQLPVIDAQAAHFGPLQVFQLETGLESGSACDAAPPDGLLVQTPEGVAEVTFLVNQVNIQMRATAFMQAQANGDMMVAVLEGEAQVTAQGVTQSVPAGMMTTIPLDANLNPTGPPTTPQNYGGDVLGAKPMAQLIAEQIGGQSRPVTLPELLEQQQASVPQTQAGAPPAAEQPPAEVPAAPTQAPQNPSPPSSGGGGGGDSGGGGGDSGGGGGAPGGGGWCTGWRRRPARLASEFRRKTVFLAAFARFVDGQRPLGYGTEFDRNHAVNPEADLPGFAIQIGIEHQPTLAKAAGDFLHFIPIDRRARPALVGRFVATARLIEPANVDPEANHGVCDDNHDDATNYFQHSLIPL